MPTTTQKTLVSVLSVALSVGLGAGAAPATASARHPGEGLAASYEVGHRGGDSTPRAAISGAQRRMSVLTPAADRPSGYPKQPQPWTHLTAADFDLELADGRFFGTASIEGAAPDTNSTPVVLWRMGNLTGETCNVIPGVVSDVFAGTVGIESADLPAGWAGATCATALLFDSQGMELDALVGVVSDVLPTLTVGSVTLFDSPKLKLVRNVWTNLEVDVANGGPGDAQDITVVGAGKGLKVRPGSAGYAITSESSTIVSIRVKLKDKKKAKLALTITGGGASASRTVAVKATPAPRKAVDGSYRDKSGDVRFKVRKGKVTGFRITTQTACGGYPAFPNNTQNNYDFPTSKIPRNGYLDARDEKAGVFDASLRMQFVGARVKKARFAYNGPNLCNATDDFKVKRVGR